MKNFKGKVFLITGASSGLGKALSYKIAENGGYLLLGSRRKEILNEIKKDIEKKFSIKVLTTYLDVSDERSVKNFIGTALENFDSIDCLINNAGIGLYGRVENVSLSDYEKLFNINVKGIFLMTKEAIPYMKNQGRGIIVNISSLAGYVSTPIITLYASSKFAVRGLTDGLRRELKSYGIKVIGVYPGPFESNFFDNAVKTEEGIRIKRRKFFFSTSEKVADKIIKGIKKGKKNIFIKPDWKIIAKLHDNLTFLFDLILSSEKYSKNLRD